MHTRRSCPPPGKSKNTRHKSKIRPPSRKHTHFCPQPCTHADFAPPPPTYSPRCPISLRSRRTSSQRSRLRLACSSCATRRTRPAPSTVCRTPHFCHMSKIKFQKKTQKAKNSFFLCLFLNVAPPLLPYVHNSIPKIPQRAKNSFSSVSSPMSHAHFCHMPTI